MLKKILDSILWFLDRLIEVSPEPGPQPVPGPIPPVPPVNPGPPVTVKNAKDYIPLKDWKVWAHNLEFSYSQWRGHKDLYFLMRYPSVMEEFKIDSGLVENYANQAFKYSEDAKNLIWRMNQPHRQFPDRSTVRKSVANEMVDLGHYHTEKHDEIVQYFIRGGVQFGVTFDSIQGYIQSRKGQ